MLKQRKKIIGFALLLIAVFLLSAFSTVTAFASDETYHTVEVSIDENWLECGDVTITGTSTNGQGQFLNGSTVTVSATPRDGYAFKEWKVTDSNGSYVRLESSFETPIEGDASYVAVFQFKSYDLVWTNLNGAAYEFTRPEKHTYQSETQIPNLILAGYNFLGWSVNGTTVPQRDLVLDGNTLYSGNTIELVAAWSPKLYNVVRYDFKPGIVQVLGATWKEQLASMTAEDLEAYESYLLGVYEGAPDTPWQAEMGSTVKGNEGGDISYTGYSFVDDEANYTERTITTAGNKVFRIYTPSTYDIVYDVNGGNAKDDWEKNNHTYDTDTVITQCPTRTGYAFSGWEIEGVFYPIDITLGESLTLVGDAYTSNITLKAIWTPNKYVIQYDEIVGWEDSEYTYGVSAVIPNPIRIGYTFIGWEIVENGKGNEKLTVTVDSNYPKLTLINDGDYARYTEGGTLALTARWIPNAYKVTFDSQDDVISVTFADTIKTDLTSVPVRPGYTFIGYWNVPQNSTEQNRICYFDGNGKANTTVQWTVPNDTELFAHWQVNSYTLTVDGIENATVEFLWGNASHPLDDKIPYGTEVTVVIKANEGYKLTMWNGETVAHTAEFTCTVTMGDTDRRCTGVVLPALAKPTFRVDYLGELLVWEDGELPEGTYVITADGLEPLTVRVEENGKVYYNEKWLTNNKTIEIFDGKDVDGILYSYFGKTVSIVRLGDAAFADSDAQFVEIKARPSALTVGDVNSDIEKFIPYNNKIGIVLSNGINNYEFAYSKSSEGKNLNWKSLSELTQDPLHPQEYWFENLDPGTIYYVYYRVTASEGTYPHGVIGMTQVTTESSDFRDSIVDQLDSLIQDGDGSNVNSVIQAAKDAVMNEPASGEFRENLEDILDQAEKEVAFARDQDKKIDALQNLIDGLKAVKDYGYDDAAMAELDALYQEISDAISGSTDKTIGTVYDALEARIQGVKVKYLFCGEMQLGSASGMPNTVRLTLSKLSELATLAESVSAAIEAERILDGDAALAYRLLSLELKAAYKMNLLNGGQAYTNFDGEYEFRLLIPADLRGATGLQVAYYDERTGQLEILDTRVEGNELIFQAESISDFLILGDPVLNLTWLILLLSAILLFQLIALVLILSKRSKYRTGARSYAFLPVSLLTVRFLPVGAETVVMVLGALVILVQILLLYLVLTSDWFYPTKRRKTNVRREELYATPAAEEAHEEGEEAPALTTLTEEELTEEEQLLDVSDEFEDHSDSSALYGVDFDPDVEDLPIEGDMEVAIEETGDEEYYALAFEADNEVLETAEVEENSETAGVDEALPEEESSTDEFFEENPEELDQEGEEVYDEELYRDETLAETLEEALALEEGFDENFIEPAADPQYSLPEEAYEELTEEFGDELPVAEEELLPEAPEFLPEEEPTEDFEELEALPEEALPEEFPVDEEFAPLPEVADAPSKENTPNATEGEDKPPFEEEEPPYYLL